MRVSSVVGSALVLFLIQVTLNACASAGGVGSKEACAAPAGDSVYQGFAPVYRACAVQHVAKQLTHKFPAWRPPAGGQSCYMADLEFVVDTTGTVIPGSANVVRTNSQEFAAVFVEDLPNWRFEPAVNAGAKVRQIVLAPVRLQGVTVVRAPAGVPNVGGTSRITPNC